MDVFKTVHMDVDQASTDNPDEVDILVKMKERPIWGLNFGVTNTMDGQNLEFNSSLRLRNLLGGAEVTQVDLTGTKESIAAGEISSMAISVRDIRTSFSSKFRNFFKLFKENQDWSNVSSFRTVNTGGIVGAVTPDGRHRVEYEAAVRHMEPTKQPTLPLIPVEGIPLVRTPSVSILREASSPSYKSAVRYTYTDNQVKGNEYVPTSGYRVVQKVEAAGFGGDVSYLKSETSAQYHHPITPTLTASITSRVGWIAPWKNLFSFGGQSDPQTNLLQSSSSSSSSNVPAAVPPGKSAVPILDRFFLDQAFVRGVPPSALGGVDGKDALGSTTYANVNAFLTKQIPNTPLSAHVFANVGTALPGCDTPINSENIVKNSHCSVGFGAVAPLAQLGRLEVNVASRYTESGFGAAEFRFILAGTDF